MIELSSLVLPVIFVASGIFFLVVVLAWESTIPNIVTKMVACLVMFALYTFLGYSLSGMFFLIPAVMWLVLLISRLEYKGTKTETGSKYCPECGLPTKPEDKFCRNCGKNLGD